MGQKVHPIGFRIGVIRETDSKWYLPKRGFADAVYEDYKIRRYIKKHKKLANAAISRIEIERAGNRVKATLFTAKPGIIIGRQGQGVEDLKNELEKFTKKQVHVSVNEIRQPDIDAQLVAESIAQQIEKRIAYKRAMRQAVLRAMKLGVKGIRIMCSGRLAGAEMARKEQDRQGKIPLHTLRADIDYGFAESATTYGNIGIKVWIYKGDVLPGQPRQSEPEPVRTNRGEGRPDRSGERSDTGRGGRGGERGGRGGRGSGGGGGDRGGRGGQGGQGAGPGGPPMGGGSAGGGRGGSSGGRTGGRGEGFGGAAQGGPRAGGMGGARPSAPAGGGTSRPGAGGGPSGVPGGGGRPAGERGPRADENVSGRDAPQGHQDQRGGEGPGGGHPNDNPTPSE